MAARERERAREAYSDQTRLVRSEGERASE